MNDEPLKLNCTVQEYIGQTVYWLDNETEITNKDDLKDGYQFMAGGWLFTAQKDQYGALYGEGNSNRLSCILRFGEDDRKCWVAVGFVNKRALEKLAKNVIIG